MQKSLNISLITEKISELGLTPSKVSRDLNISREAVSQWFKGESFPRADRLLKLGQLLQLKFSELVIKEGELEPIVAFRKVGNTKTTEKHLKRAKEMGYALEKLVKYLPFETMTKAPEFNQPKNEYCYLQAAASVVRDYLGITKIKVEASEIISGYQKLKTILIPLMLGNKKQHENALHINLPSSTTNWVYINLDTNELDFKFWLVHELGHIFTPSLRGDESEEFSDNFAGAFLYPSSLAKEAYAEIIQINSDNNRIKYILEIANRYVISANTIYLEINKWAENNNLDIINLGTTFYAWNNKFEQKYKLVSTNMFGSEKPEASKFIEIAEREFQTIFFELLRKYKHDVGFNSSYLKNVLNLSISDTIEMYNTMDHGVYENSTRY